MDPYSLSVEREASENIEENESECFKDAIVSSTNLNEDFVEPTNLRNAIREIVACIIAASFHIAVGITLAYSVLFIFLFLNVHMATYETEEISWIEYFQDIIYILCGYVLVGALLGGFLMEIFGRVRALQIGAILSVIGWILIACSNDDTWMIQIGYLLRGLSIALGTSPAIVYITEVARPELRGSLISFGPTLTLFGMLLTYLKHSFLNWRLVIFLNIIYSIVPVIMVPFWVPESPVWLVSKGRIEDAKKSLERLYKNEKSQDKISVIEAQFTTIMKENEIKLNEQRRSKHGNASNKLRGFLKPTGWKPMTILFFFFAFQQFSGIYITLSYMMDWFWEVGVDVYVVFILGSLFLCFMINIWLLKRYKRRMLCIISFFGMAICMTVSGYFSLNIKNGYFSGYWVPVLCLLLYELSSMFGMLTIPWTMTAELFPTEIRGIAQSINYFMANMLMIAALLSYQSLKAFLGGSYAVQWFFAGVSVGAALFVWLMLPETHGKKLSEIEEYFHNNFLALGTETKNKKRQAQKRAQQKTKSLATESLNLKNMQKSKVYLSFFIAIYEFCMNRVRMVSEKVTKVLDI